MGTAPKRAAGEPDARAFVHELANLVQAVSGNLELLAARAADERSERYLANARSAARQLEDLILKLRGEAD